MRHIRGALSQFLALVWLTLMLVATSGGAQAQAVDWLVNVDDSGFEFIPAGGTIEYVVDVDNNGFSTAPATTITIDVPAGTTMTGVQSGATITGCAPLPSVGPSAVTCNVPSLVSNGQASLVALVETTQDDVIYFTVTVANPGGVDTAPPGNNSFTEETTVTEGSDIGIELTIPATAAAGSIINVLLTATNNGPNIADEFTVEFPIPAGLAIVAAPPGCVLTATTYSCLVSGPVAVGATVNLSFDAQVGVAEGSNIIATTSVGGADPGDSIVGNNTDSGGLIVTAGTDLTVSIERSPGGTILTGDPVDFTISSAYSGDVPTAIEITHTVPANYSIDAISAPGWTVVQVGNQLTFTRATGSVAGIDVDLGDIVISTTTISPGTPVSSVEISTGSPAESNLANNTDDVTVTIEDAVVDLQANKTGPIPALAVVGNSYEFAISTSNVGNADFFGTVVMTDTIPAGLTVDTVASFPWDCTPTAPFAGLQVVTCELIYPSFAPLAAGDQTPVVTFGTTVTTAGILSNQLVVGSPDANIADLNSPNDTITYDVTAVDLPDSADVSVIKTVSLDPLAAGEVQTYTIEIVNDGPATSTDVDVFDALGSLINNGSGPTGQGFVGQSFVAGLASGMVCDSTPNGSTGRLLDCNIASLPVCVAGTTCPVITVEVRHGGEAGAIFNEAIVESQATPDADLDNNKDDTSFAQTATVDVTIDKSVNATSIPAGQAVIFTIAPLNVDNGQSSAEDVQVVDTLPDDTIFLGTSLPAGVTCPTSPAINSVTGPGNNQLICNFGTLANGQQLAATVTLRPTNDAIGDTLTNSAIVSTTSPEVDVEPNTDIADVSVLVPVTDLSVNKDDGPDPLPLGDDTTYVLTVTNGGPSASQDIVLTDVMPASVISFQSVNFTGPTTCSAVPALNSFGGTLTCEHPYLAVGESFTVSIVARGAAKGNVTNNVSISSFEIANGYDTRALNNLTSETTTVRTRANLATTKTASAATVELEENFNFTIEVAATTGLGLSEADDVGVTDTLPAGMVLTGAPVPAAGTCTGVAGGTSFSCSLGTINAGTSVIITVPVEVISLPVGQSSRTNTANTVTSSFEAVTTDNQDSETVTVNSSSIAGTVFRDFADDAAITAGDTRIGSVPMTLTGTTADGRSITRNLNTDSNGNFLFDRLPAGDYTVTRGTVTEAFLVNGTNSAGSEGGIVASPTVINTIPLPGNTAAVDYLFPLIPQARIGISKALASPLTINADGSFNATFNMTVENFSLEALNAIEVADTLAGAAPLFGTQTTVAVPATTALTPGQYVILTAPSGTCGSLNAGFNGSTNDVLATGFSLASNATCTISVSIRVQPVEPLPPVLASGGRYENQSSVTGTGALSGQTPTDLSDNGTNPDPNGNNDPTQSGENDPTPMAPVYTPGIALIKLADTTGLSSPPAPLDEVTYTFQVRNTGNVTLTGITLTDTLPGLLITGGPIASLAPNTTDSTTFTATYPLTQADIDEGLVTNTATVTGTDPFDQDVTDDSGSDFTNDTPTVATVPRVASVAVVKIADDSGVQVPARIGDEITYTFEVRNTGNVTLRTVTLDDPLLGVDLVGGPIVQLDPGQTDTTTFTASYLVQQADIDVEEVVNQAEVLAQDPDEVPVSDLSGDTFDDDNPIVVPLVQGPSIAVIKRADVTALSSPPVAGETVSYTFEVTNTGNLPLTDITLTDPLADIILSGGSIALLDPDDVDTTTFTATYVLKQADIDAGEVVNSATVSGIPVIGVTPQPPVEDISGTTNADDDPTVVPLAQDPSIALIKTADTSALSNPPLAGETVTFAFEVQNTGNVILTDITITDPLTGVVLSGGPLASLDPDEIDTATFTATYALTQIDVDNGFIENTATVEGIAPDLSTVDDDSGTDFTNDTPTIVPLTDDPGIRLIKTADVTGLSSPPLAGEEISYAFTVTNIGNVTLTNVTLTDMLTGIVISGGPIATLDPADVDTTTFTATYALTQADIDASEVINTATVSGTPPSGPNVEDVSGTTNTDDDPTIVELAQSPAIALIKTADTSALQSPPQFGDVISYDFAVRNIGNVTLTNVNITDILPGIVLMGGPIPRLEPGAVDTASFSATYRLTLADIVAGEVENSATVTGTPPSGPPVTDISGTSTGDDEPTVVPITQSPSITLDKVSDDSNVIDGAVPGELITYTFTITNTGNMPLTTVTLTDALPGVVLLGGPIAVMNPAAVGDGTDVDSTTYTASYAVTAADIAAVEIPNTATVTGFYDPAETLTVSAEDEEITTVGTIEAISEVFPPFQTDGGTTTIMLASDLLNGQPATLDNVTITVISADPGVTLDPATGLITLEPGRPAGVYQVEYQICSIAFPGLCDTAIETVIQLPLAAIEVTKTQELTDNGDGITGVGDTVTYTILVQNTGNTVLTNVELVDTLTDLDGVVQTLTSGPDFQSADQSSPQGTLLIDETATYSATFVLTPDVVNAGGLENVAVGTALPVIPPGVPVTAVELSDTSDDGIDDDGNTTDDPTVLIIPPNLSTDGLTLVKTTPRAIVERGSVVPYTITITNANANGFGPATITDSLPDGFLYVPDSAELDGAPAAVTLSGNHISLADVVVPAQGEVVLTLSARILNGTGPGVYTNSASVIDPDTGDPLLGPATADVQILPEAVFDCGDVIGKVFDDVNGNGYQDGAEPMNNPAITDQTYYGGKADTDPVAEDTTENGLPGIRLATVDGTVITTDENGLFHVPCAMLPADDGSNFILKLDERTLPSGFSMTTENPRVMRLTPGMLTEMNFGAHLGAVLRVDLGDAAFGNGAGEMSAALQDGIGALVARIAADPVNISLIYHIDDDADAAAVALARQRMDLVEAEIARQWQEVGRGALRIQQSIARAGQ